MGILQSALTSKSLEREGNEKFRVGSCSMQGCRISMEDAHKVALVLPQNRNNVESPPAKNDGSNSNDNPVTSFFGVFDGHGGKAASKFIEANVIEKVSALSEFSDEKIASAFIELDKEFTADTNKEHRENGTTCVFVLVTEQPEKKNGEDKEYGLICANLGDSRALLLRSDGTWQPLSHDHKPDNEEEKTRIEEAGGMVRAGRVDGSLAVSRAFGDWSLKCNPELQPGEQKVSCVPDIIRTTCKSGDYIFLCCDGIFEHLTNEQVVGHLREKYNTETKDPAKTLTYIFEAALDSGSTDNMSGILVDLTDGTDYNLGEQYLPGRLFSHESNHTFFDAYLTDATEHGFPNNSLLKLMGYQQDLRFYISKSDAANKQSVEQEIRALEPETMGVEALKHVINTYERNIFVKDEHITTLKQNSMNFVQDVTTHCNSPKWESLDIPKNVKDQIKELSLCWDSIPAEIPTTPVQNYDDLGNSSSSSGDLSGSSTSSGEEVVASFSTNSGTVFHVSYGDVVMCNSSSTSEGTAPSGDGGGGGESDKNETDAVEPDGSREDMCIDNGEDESGVNGMTDANDC